jgi:hypothetical protein
MKRHLLVTLLGLLALLAAGCIKPPGEKTQTGPTILVTLDPDSGFEATSAESMPDLTLPTNATQYSFDLIVDTTRGQAYDGSTSMYPDVTNVNASITLAGANIPALTLTVDTTMSEWSYKSQKITVPASFKMQSLVVRADAHDDDGLASNIIDFTCLLR